MKAYLRLLWKRFKSTTPKYFRKAIHFGIGLGTLGGVLVAAGDTIPEVLQTPSKYMIAIGLTIATCYKTTTTSKTLTEASEELVNKDKEKE